MGIAALVLAGFLGNAPQAQAALLTGFAGNTQPLIDSTEGFINFAVYDATTGGSVGDQYGTGLAGIDVLLAANGFSITSRYLYLFENVNEGVDIASSSVNADGSAVTGAGKLAGLNFTQVAAGSLFLGPAAATPGNPSPAVTGATAAQATPIAAVTYPPLAVTVNPTSVVATYTPPEDGVNAVGSLWGYTTNRGPVISNGSIQDSGLAANGRVPANLVTITAIPEPSSMALAGLGAMGLVGYGLRRRKVLGA